MRFAALSSLLKVNGEDIVGVRALNPLAFDGFEQLLHKHFMRIFSKYAFGLRLAIEPFFFFLWEALHHIPLSVSGFHALCMEPTTSLTAKFPLKLHCSVGPVTVHGTHKSIFSTKILFKIGPTALFTHLKIILLQYFQFLVFNKINNIQTDLKFPNENVTKLGKTYFTPNHASTSPKQPPFASLLSL